jgi:hypothetical protein
MIYASDERAPELKRKVTIKKFLWELNVCTGLFGQDGFLSALFLGVFLCLFQFLFDLEYMREPFAINLVGVTVLNFPGIRRVNTYGSQRWTY